MKASLRMKGSRMPNLWYYPPMQMFEPFSYLIMKLKKSSPPQADKPLSSTAPYTESSGSDSSSDDFLKTHDNILPFTKHQLIFRLYALKQEAEFAARTKSSTNMARNLAKEEARLLAINKPKVIKVVREEEKKLGIHLKEAITAKAGEKFKKAQDAEHEVLKKKHVEKVKKSLELKKHKYDNYINFDVHNPFAFDEFGISELDKLSEIIPRKKNIVVKYLMNSLRQRYERIKKIPKELRIPLALPAPIPEQASSKSLRRKRKHMDIEQEINIPRLNCNRTLFKNIPFLNNMVIEEPEYRIFFTNEFSDQAF
nr:hypothetical protein [Tanacetum cinerariifolium]